MKTQSPLLKGIHWTAMILGSLLVIITLIIAIGSHIEGIRKADPSEHGYSFIILLIFAVWGIGLAGLLLALWKPWQGGWISLIAFILSPFLNLFNDESTQKATPFIIFLVFIIPSVLYLVYAKQAKNQS